MHSISNYTLLVLRFVDVVANEDAPEETFYGVCYMYKFFVFLNVCDEVGPGGAGVLCERGFVSDDPHVGSGSGEHDVHSADV